MKQKKTAQEKFNQLRRQAEELMRTKNFVTAPAIFEDPLKLIHELQTSQIELELQNEELRLSQIALMDSQASYTELYDFAPVGYLTLNLKGLILKSNLTLADMLSMERSYLINQPFSAHIVFENQDIFYRHLRELSESKTRQICKLQLQKKGGVPFHVQLESIIVSDKSGEVSQYRTQVIDITKRFETEKCLIDVYEIIKQSPAVAFLWRNSEGWPVEFVSENVMELIGYSADEFISGNLLYTKIVHPGDLKRVAGEVASFSKGKELKRFIHEPYRIVTKGGSIKWISDRTYIRRDKKGKITHYQGIISDITDRKHAEDLVRDLSQRLIQAQEKERQMISRELHDSIAQNLSTLKLYCSRLFKDQSYPESDIKGSLTDVSNLLDLTIAAVRNLAYDLRPPSLDHMGLVHALEIFCEEFDEKNNIAVDFQAVGIHKSILNSDTQINLYRLVMEGLNNIQKHAAASKAIIRLVGAYPDIILRIKDNGKGFDVKERERAIVNEKRMGLRSMKERVNLLQGQMSIHSRLNKGTEIVIKLPLKDKQ